MYGKGMYSLKRKLPNCFQKAVRFYTPHSTDEWPSFSVALPHLETPLFFISVILIGVSWYLIAVLICISLMSTDVEHLFMCLFVLCISSSVKCLSMSCAHCWIVYCWTVQVLLIFYMQSLVVYMVSKHFLPVYKLFFPPINIVFLRGNVYSFDEVQFIIFPLMIQAYGIKSKNSLPSPISEDFLLHLFLKVLLFCVLHLSLWSFWADFSINVNMVYLDVHLDLFRLQFSTYRSCMLCYITIYFIFFGVIANGIVFLI